MKGSVRGRFFLSDVNPGRTVLYQKTATECIFFGECFFGAEQQHKFKVPRQALNLIDATQFLSKFPTECSSPCGVAVLGWEARALSDLPPPLGSAKPTSRLRETIDILSDYFLEEPRVRSVGYGEKHRCRYSRQLGWAGSGARVTPGPSPGQVGGSGQPAALFQPGTPSPLWPKSNFFPVA